ncbi:hypothetical protein Hanom_Chr08g00727201 [Helianthus anomalus]
MEGATPPPMSGRAGRENSAKTMVSDQISQAVLSTSNLIRMMLHASPSQAFLSLRLLYFGGIPISSFLIFSTQLITLE